MLAGAGVDGRSVVRSEGDGDAFEEQAEPGLHEQRPATASSNEAPKQNLIDVLATSDRWAACDAQCRIVCDSGDGVTHVVPVYEGFLVPHAVGRVHLAGRELTEYVMKLVAEAGTALSTSAERDACLQKTLFLSL
eukprot:g12793.t1